MQLVVVVWSGAFEYAGTSSQIANGAVAMVQPSVGEVGGGKKNRSVYKRIAEVNTGTILSGLY